MKLGKFCSLKQGGSEKKTQGSRHGSIAPLLPTLDSLMLYQLLSSVGLRESKLDLSCAYTKQAAPVFFFMGNGDGGAGPLDQQ